MIMIMIMYDYDYEHILIILNQRLKNSQLYPCKKSSFVISGNVLSRLKKERQYRRWKKPGNLTAATEQLTAAKEHLTAAGEYLKATRRYLAGCEMLSGSRAFPSMDNTL